MSVFIAYLDTSSLVKLFFEEEGSEEVRRLVGSASVIATSGVAYVEARATFARKRRLNLSTDEEHRQVSQDFEVDWSGYLSIGVSSALIRMAGVLAEKHGLRGFDAIHLTSALSLKSSVETPTVFSCADRRLLQAAQAEGLYIEA